MSDEKMTVHQALAWIQKRINVPKDKQNKQFNFRDISGINQAFRELKSDNSIPQDVSSCSLILDDEMIKVGENGNRIIIKGSATLQDKDGNKITCNGFAEIDTQNKFMQLPQLYGACSSYARKYAAQGLFALQDSENDLDRLEKSHVINRIKSTLSKKFPKGIPQALNEHLAKVNNKTDIQELLEIHDKVESHEK